MKQCKTKPKSSKSYYRCCSSWRQLGTAVLTQLWSPQHTLLPNASASSAPQLIPPSQGSCCERLLPCPVWSSLSCARVLISRDLCVSYLTAADAWDSGRRLGLRWKFTVSFFPCWLNKTRECMLPGTRDLPGDSALIFFSPHGFPGNQTVTEKASITLAQCPIGLSWVCERWDFTMCLLLSCYLLIFFRWDPSVGDLWQVLCLWANLPPHLSCQCPNHCYKTFQVYT